MSQFVKHEALCCYLNDVPDIFSGVYFYSLMVGNQKTLITLLPSAFCRMCIFYITGRCAYKSV